MLTLTNRPCKVGSNVNSRTEKHGDEDVPAADIALAGLMLEAEELNALLEDPYAHNALYNHRSKGKADEPIFRKFHPLRFKEKFEEAEVVLTVGLGSTEIRLRNVKLARVTLDPQVGGLTELSLQVQCTPSTDTIAQILQYMNHEVEAEVSFGKKVAKADKQKEMPLGFGDGEEPEQGEDKPKRGRRRKGGDSEAPSLQ